MTGLEPREFTWVIRGRLAVSERIGGYGFQHRRVRREEEIAWLLDNGVTAVLSLLDSNQNINAYEEAGFQTAHEPLGDLERDDLTRIFKAIERLLSGSDGVVLVHRDIIDDTVAGLLAGFLVFSRRIDDPIVATAVIQEILKRPLGPEARRLIATPVES
jgi:hypothetical protein